MFFRQTSELKGPKKDDQSFYPDRKGQLHWKNTLYIYFKPRLQTTEYRKLKLFWIWNCLQILVIGNSLKQTMQKLFLYFCQKEVNKIAVQHFITWAEEVLWMNSKCFEWITYTRRITYIYTILNVSSIFLEPRMNVQLNYLLK